jgi:hypothetical protein
MCAWLLLEWKWSWPVLLYPTGIHLKYRVKKPEMNLDNHVSYFDEDYKHWTLESWQKARITVKQNHT